MNIEQIYNLNQINEKDILLILSFDGGVRGMDFVKYINKETGHYTYINHAKHHFEGNIKKIMSYNSIFKVDETIYQYSDKLLKSAVLDLEWVFENMYGEQVGRLTREKIFGNIEKDFNKRIELIDFCNTNKDIIHKVRWEDDEELGYTNEEILYAKKILSENLNKTKLIR